MKIHISIHNKDTLVYYKIARDDLGRAIKRVQYIHWNFNNSIERQEVYVGTTTEIARVVKFMEEVKL